MSTIHGTLNQAAADALRALTVLDSTLAVIRDAQRGQPGAQRYDAGRGGSSSLWCDVHEREVRECEKDDLDCDGQTIELHDPTGEAAMKGDRARDALRFLEKQAEAMARAGDAIVRELNAWNHRAVLTESERVSTGECEECGKHCDGSSSNRLRTVGQWKLCDACRMRRARAAAKAAS